MDNTNTFSYTYNAKNHQEVLDIRSKYLPKEETKLDELKRLDHTVQKAGVVASLCVGVTGCLIFGLGMCLSMEVLGQILWLGIPVGILGALIMALAYPVYRRQFTKVKTRLTPRILELVDQLRKEN